MRHTLKTLCLTAAIAACAPAWAAPVTYQFDIVVDGTSYQGTFSFDSSSITPGAINSATNLLTDLDIDLTGITGLVAYDETTANTGALGFDASGNLNQFIIGSDCGSPTPTSCGNGFGDWEASWIEGRTGFFSTNFLGPTINGTVEDVSRVPEPGTLALLGVALAGLTLTRRRRP